jgi:hypothetical protein
MSRQSTDREDLLREATGLKQRIELRLADVDKDSRESSRESIVAGYRNNGSLTVYFGGDPVFQFNTDLELRRVFHHNHPMKAEAGQLVVLRRVRESEQTVLYRRVLSEEEQAALINEACQRLEEMLKRLQLGDYRCVGKVPADVEIEQRLQADLERLVTQPMRIAALPNVGAGKKPNHA